MHRLLIATRNRHKTAEIGQMLGPRFALHDLTSYPALPEVDETGATFAENAALKAVETSLHFGADDPRSFVLADDSGLEVDALGGAPGVRSARYAGEKAGDYENLALLLSNLHGKELRSARFRCVIAIASRGKLLASFDGLCEGRILDQPKGSGGFGYDPVFQPEGESQTFAELPPENKNRISHRAKALQLALRWMLGWEAENTGASAGGLIPEAGKRQG